MKINVTQRITAEPNLLDLLKRIAYQVNLLSEGSISARYNAAIAPPTTGRWAQGDRLTNSAPAELGTAGSKYVITDWLCVASGTPGTWIQLRSLTGN